MTRTNPHLEILASAPALAARAAEFFVSSIAAGLQDRHRFVVALSGGRTPHRFNQAIVDLARTTARASAAATATRAAARTTAEMWNRVHVLYADERAVPIDHEANNHRMTEETLLRQIAVLPQHVHRINADDGDHVRAARDYSQLIVREYKEHIDLIVLGMGEDGHTASLFPDAETKAEAEAHSQVDGPEANARTIDDEVAIPTFAPRNASVRRRVSLSYRSIVGADAALVLVSGPSKASRFAQVWAGVDAQVSARDRALPLENVLQLRATLGRPTRILIDQDAGALIEASGRDYEPRVQQEEQ
ncbi:MAG: 6-phosphogluconolactonase [Deltaproteobacteria bacterium]|nr:6-phosphogluconolactonase [Deltaproteobacteria bacterium]